ncbi:MAG: hypothetical protein LBC53_02100 [Spirochaetaceae bacterium]|nr:hypothetical protein [Spirochaetaceae bacterium]
MFKIIKKINVSGIKRLNLNNDKRDYSIKIKTNGIGLPKHHVGRMMLNNWNKAPAYITDKTNVILISTKNYDILTSGGDFNETTVVKKNRKLTKINYGRIPRDNGLI